MTVLGILAAWTALSVISGLLVGRWLKICSQNPALPPARNDLGPRRKLAATDAHGPLAEARGGHLSSRSFHQSALAQKDI